MEDGDDDLAINHRSISEILADASPGSVVENTAGARGGVASNAAAPRENVAPITATPGREKAPIAATTKAVASTSAALQSCVVPPASQGGFASLTDTQLGPGVKKKRNRKKAP